MKPPDDIKGKVVAEWLRKADADFDLADYLLAEGAAFPNAIAFNAHPKGVVPSWSVAWKSKLSLASFPSDWGSPFLVSVTPISPVRQCFGVLWFP
jgi:hypothetical protein